MTHRWWYTTTREKTINCYTRYGNPYYDYKAKQGPAGTNVPQQNNGKLNYSKKKGTPAKHQLKHTTTHVSHALHFVVGVCSRSLRRLLKWVVMRLCLTRVICGNFYVWVTLERCTHTLWMKRPKLRALWLQVWRVHQNVQFSTLTFRMSSPRTSV